MRNLIRRNLTLRKGFVTGVLLLVIINILIISSYYRLFLSDIINEKYQELIFELEKDMEQVMGEIKYIDDYDGYFKEYAKDKEILIDIYDSDNKVVNSYGEKEDRKNVSVSRMVEYGGKYYLVNISQRSNVLNFRIALEFLLFEIVNILILALFGIILSNFKILEPITSLTKDFNNYKLGIIPKKRHINGEVDVLQNDFVELVNDLEEEKHKQSRIIASISHDIKTPLTSIMGYSDRIVSSDKLSEEMKNKYARIIYNKSLSLKEIVEEFDDYLSCNIKDEKKCEKISIKYIVEYLKNYYRDDLKEKGIEFRVKTNCPNSIIEVDLAKFKRIFSNVIINSIRHYDKKKKILNIYINIQKDDTIVFEIADNGMGCKDDLDKIFEPLYTTDKSRKISGLGLSICREIVLSHQGEIKAVNNKMGGFSIIFTLNEYKEV